jgi:hypothetical protein
MSSQPNKTPSTIELAGMVNDTGARETVSTGAKTSTLKSEDARAIVHKPTGDSVYYFRIDAPTVKLVDPVVAGNTILSISVDAASLDEQIFALSQKFMYYQVENLQVTMKPTAPFATASGSVQLYYNPDPTNAEESDPAEALTKAMRIINSVQVTSKSEASLSIDKKNFYNPVLGSDWRYCKNSLDERLNGYGVLKVVARAPPTQGDFAAWAVTIEGKVNFMGATEQTSASTSTETFQVNCDNVDGDPNYSAEVVQGKIRVTLPLLDTDPTQYAGYYTLFNYVEDMLEISDGVDTITSYIRWDQQGTIPTVLADGVTPAIGVSQYIVSQNSFGLDLSMPLTVKSLKNWKDNFNFSGVLSYTTNYSRSALALVKGNPTVLTKTQDDSTYIATIRACNYMLPLEKEKAIKAKLRGKKQ